VVASFGQARDRATHPGALSAHPESRVGVERTTMVASPLLIRDRFVRHLFSDAFRQ
jgi:hypothetical protein